MPTRPPLSRRILLTASFGTAVVATAVGLALFAGGGKRATPLTVKANDVSVRATACLATDSTTAAGNDTVAKIWSAMQAAGAQHERNVQQMVEPATNAEQAGPHLASLVVQRCDLIVTVGVPFGQASTGIASAAPSVRITAVDSALAAAPTNVSLLSGPDSIRSITEQVSSLQRQP